MVFRSVNVLQALDFPTVCTDLKISPSFLVSVGTYKPCLKIHNLNELALKNERNLENEPLKVEILENDAKKLAILRNDRYIEIHAKYGLHHTIRLPTYGRDLLYNHVKAELLTLTDDNVIRLNLEEGRFMKSINQTCATCFDQSFLHNLLAVGCEDGISFYDYRTKAKVSELNVTCANAVSFKRYDGLYFCAGNKDGTVNEYDIRSKNPLHVHQHKESVKQIKYNDNSLCIMTNDTLFVYKNAKSISELAIDNMNAFVFDKGLYFIASEAHDIQTFFDSQINEAPTWCTFIDDFTNDLDDFVVVENEYVLKNNLEKLIDDGDLKIFKNTYYLKKTIYNKLIKH